MSRIVASAIFAAALAACGSPSDAAPAPEPTATTTTTTPVVEGSERVVIDGSHLGDDGIDGQWVVTADPDGVEHLCFVVAEERVIRDGWSDAKGGGVGIGVSCHERGPR